MDPIYMADLMHGGISNKKKESAPPEALQTQLAKDIESQFDRYIDGLMLEEETAHSSLLSSEAKKEKFKLEIKAAIKFPKLTAYLEKAVDLIYTDAPHYLPKEHFAALQSDFDNISTYLEEVPLEKISKESLQNLAHIKDESLQSIADIALAKFTEESYSACLALFCLLSMLNPTNPEYWFRQGIAAQKSQDFELAAHSYAAASILEPHFIGTRLLAAECLINTQQPAEAKHELNIAKEIVQKQQVDQEWLDLIPLIESQLEAP